MLLSTIFSPPSYLINLTPSKVWKSENPFTVCNLFIASNENRGFEGCTKMLPSVTVFGGPPVWRWVEPPVVLIPLSWNKSSMTFPTTLLFEFSDRLRTENLWICELQKLYEKQIRNITENIMIFFWNYIST